MMTPRPWSACLCLLAACASAPAPGPEPAPPPSPPAASAAPAAPAVPASAAAAKGPARVVNQQVELCARSGPDGAMSLAASFGPGCETTTMTCQVRPAAGGLPATALDVEVKVGAVSPGSCPRPTVVASSDCPLPSHVDPKASEAGPISDLPQQSSVPLRLNGAELGTLATDEFARPRPGQCWRMPLPRP